MKSKSTNDGDDELIVVSRREYEHLTTFAAEADVTRLPPADERGLYPAVEACRALTARDVAIRRLELRLTRAELAALAGVRPSTLEELESGVRAISTRTLRKIESALRKAARKKRKPSKRV
jgi:DNA-binding XRE family transcriptional regulator